MAKLSERDDLSVEKKAAILAEMTSLMKLMGITMDREVILHWTYRDGEVVDVWPEGVMTLTALREIRHYIQLAAARIGQNDTLVREHLVTALARVVGLQIWLNDESDKDKVPSAK